MEMKDEPKRVLWVLVSRKDTTITNETTPASRKTGEREDTGWYHYCTSKWCI